MDDPSFALPVINPLDVKLDYQMLVNEEGLESLGKMTEENTFILVTITVPEKIEEMSVNLKAPFVINTDNLQGAQMIVEDDYPIKYKIYEILNKKKAGE